MYNSLWMRSNMSEEHERWTLTNPTKGKLEYTWNPPVCSICNKSFHDEILVPLDITKPVSTNGDNVVHKSCKEKHSQETVEN